MEKGLLRIPYEEYEKAEGERQSNIKCLLRSPAHYLQALNEHNDSPALAFGRALHVAVLEPHLFDEQFIIAPKIDKRTNAGKAEWAALYASGKEILDYSDGETIEGIKKAISGSQTASKILNLSSEREGSIFWNDRETGIACKARLDAVCPAMRAVVDLKSTEDASAEFSRSLYKYGYHLQAAHTLNGCAVLDLPFDSFIFIAVEKSPPYGIGVYQIDQRSLIAGTSKVQELLWTLKRCKETNEWPGYPDKIQSISLPGWALRQMEETHEF